MRVAEQNRLESTYDRSIQKLIGKSIIAAMRKLITILNVMIRENKLWKPDPSPSFVTVTYPFDTELKSEQQSQLEFQDSR